MNQERETIKKTLLSTESGKIQFRSYLVLKENPRQPSVPNLKALVEPKRNPGTNWYYGVDRISEEEKRSTTDLYVDPTDKDHPLSSYELEHNKEMDLSMKENRLILKWLVECDHILGLSYEEKKNSPTARFYVYNEELDTKKRISRLDLKDRAIEMLRDVSDSDIGNIARLMGMHLGNKSPKEIRISIRELFEEPRTWFDKVQKFVQVVNDPERKYKLFVFHAVDKGIITQTEKGEYYWGEIFMGYSMGAVIAFLRDNKNRNILNEIANLSQQVPPYQELKKEAPIEKEEDEDSQESTPQPKKRGRPKKS